MKFCFLRIFIFPDKLVYFISLTMKFFVAFLALAACVAVVSAALETNCPYTPPKRNCGWNLEMKCKSDKGSSSSTIYVNGRYIVMHDYKSNGDVDTSIVVRPDLDNTTCTYTNGKCACDRSSGLEFLIANALSEPTTFPTCEDGEYNGKKVKKYYSGIGLDLYVADGEPIVLVENVGLGVSATCDLSFGSGASMSKFAFSEKQQPGCSKDGVYKSGDNKFTFCAASSVKAALAVVLAALLVVLF